LSVLAVTELSVALTVDDIDQAVEIVGWPQPAQRH